MTASQFCWAIVEKFQKENGCSEVKPGHITLSSCLAVAMEYLGLLTNPEDRAYAAERAGILYQFVAEPDPDLLPAAPIQSFLTVRDMIRLLEDQEKREKEDEFGFN